MKFINGTRTFIVDRHNIDDRGYYKVRDISSKQHFWLPDYVISQMVFLFSWDTYKEDFDISSLQVLRAERNKCYLTHKCYSDLGEFIDSKDISNCILNSKLKGLL